MHQKTPNSKLQTPRRLQIPSSKRDGATRLKKSLTTDPAGRDGSTRSDKPKPKESKSMSVSVRMGRFIGAKGKTLLPGVLSLRVREARCCLLSPSGTELPAKES